MTWIGFIANMQNQILPQIGTSQMQISIFRPKAQPRGISFSFKPFKSVSTIGAIGDISKISGYCLCDSCGGGECSGGGSDMVLDTDA